jgi:hypothetical protein
VTAVAAQATFLLGGELHASLFAQLIHQVVDFLVGPKCHEVATLDIVESFFGGGAEPL